MRTLQFPICCGVQNVYDFPFISYFDTPSEKRVKQKKVLTYLKSRDKRFRQDGAFMLAILNDHQKEHYHDIFHKQGWRIIKYKLNQNSASCVWLYCKNTPER